MATNPISGLIPRGSLGLKLLLICLLVLVMGVPGKVVRDLTPEEIAHLDASAKNYVGYARSYRTSEIVKEAGC